MIYSPPVVITSVHVIILDGYIDEPSRLGVPPFLSPYPRYLAGAVEDSGSTYSYMTIDQVRAGAELVGDLLVIIAGTVVPGRYLRSLPMSEREMVRIADGFEGTRILAGPLPRFGPSSSSLENHFDFVSRKDSDAFLSDFLRKGKARDRNRTMKEWASWALLGSKVALSHPDYPQPLIVEIDSSRGCARYFTGGCSFCVEPLYGRPQFRRPETIIREVKKLHSLGVVNFRLGGQACFFSYMAEDVGKTETPEPNLGAIKSLLSGIRKVAPGLKVLHTDNANPALIAAHPKISKEIARLIVENCTSGNVLSLGMESADPDVIEANNLGSTPEDVRKAIEVINEVGRERGPTGLPRLLPGLNFISGLLGESAKTFDLNYRFLVDIAKAGLLLRRINIRQVLPVRRDFPVRKHYKEFREFKRKVRENVDRPMLKRMLPRGTILGEVYMEIQKGNKTFGRQVGSYPLLVCLPYKTDVNRFVNVVITDYGFRSVTGFEYPMKVNQASIEALSSIPGIGERRARRIVISRPIHNERQFLEAMDDERIARRVAKYLDFVL